MLSEPTMVGRFERHELPDGPPVYFEADKHAYYGEVKESPKAKGGYSFVRSSRLSGVSTIAKYLDPNADPLMHWAAKLDQIGIAELASRAIDAGADLTWLCSQESIRAALYEAQATWAHVRDRAAVRGTNVHERIFLALATGATPPSLADLTEEERGYGQAAFAWWRDHQPEPIAAEYISADHTLGVAGRPDLLARIDGEVVRFDAKTRETGKDRMSDHVQLQGYKVTDRACGIGESDREVVLILMPDGTYREVPCRATEAHFNAALVACRAGKEVAKAMRAAKSEREAVSA